MGRALDAPLSGHLRLQLGNLFIVAREVLQADLAILVPVRLLELMLQQAACMCVYVCVCVHE